MVFLTLQNERRKWIQNEDVTVRIFNNHIDAEHALHELNRFGFSVDQISMVGLDVDLDDQLGGASMSDYVGNKTRLSNRKFDN